MKLLDTFLKLNPGAAVLKNGDCTVVLCAPSKPSVDLLLKHNDRNRPIRENPIRAIISDINTGRYFLTAQGIGISDETLLDGQHRLTAAAASDDPPKMLFVFGLDPQSQSVVDQHAKRSIVDAIKLFVNSDVSARAVATVRQIASCKGLAERDVDFQMASRTFSVNEVADLCAEWQTELAVTSRFKLSAPILATATAYARLFDLAKAGEFCESLCSGADLCKDSPVLRLSKFLKENRVAGNTERLKFIQMTAAALKLFDVGRNVQLLKGAASW